MPDDRDVVLDHPDDRGTTRARRGAGLYDLLAVTWAIGFLAVPAREVAPIVGGSGLLALWLVLVVVEGVTGASPGKHVTGLRVQRLDGRRVTVATAALRRPWGWLLPLQLVGSTVNLVAAVVAAVTVVAMLVSIERSDDRRGFHDRIAGTRVVEGTLDRRARLVVVALTIAAALTGVVLGSMTTPLTPA